MNRILEIDFYHPDMLQALKTGMRAVLLALFFAFFGFAVALVVQRSFLIGLAVLLALGLLGFMLRWPEAGTMFVMFVVYSNLAVAILHFRTQNQPINGPMDTGLKSFLLGSVGLVLVVPLFYYLIVRRDLIVLDRTFKYILLFLVALVLASIFCRDEFLATTQILDFLIEGLTLYLLIINVVRDWPTLRKVIWTVLLAGVFMGSLTIFQEATHTTQNDYWGLAQRGGVFGVGANGNTKIIRTRAAGPIGEENRYAQIMLVLIPLAVFRFRNEHSRFLRLAALSSGVVIIGAIVLTFSRGAFVSLLFLLFLMVGLHYIKRSYVFTVLVVGSIVVVVAEPDYLARLGSLGRVGAIFNTSQNARPDTDISALRRFAGNLASLEVWMDYPVLGVGPGLYAKYYATPAVNQLGLIQQEKNFPSHNLYLEMAAETGAVGLICFMAIIGQLAIRLWRERKELAGKDSEASDLATAFFLSIIAYLVSGIFEHLAYPRYFWLLIALATVAARCARAEATPEPETLPPLLTL
jgi:putative inorganic carbon (HCO3(-)) transporter